MASAADIFVKKSDGTTDIKWSLVAASGGDNAPATWRCNGAIGTLGQRPTYTIAARWNGQKTARRIDMQVAFPSVYTDSASGLTQVRSKGILSLTAVLPMDMADSDRAEYAAQAANLIASALSKDTLTNGYAPT